MTARFVIDEPQTVRKSEEDRIRDWRFEVLSNAGYPRLLAAEIAHSDADLHLAASLLAQGCSPRIAAQILL